MTPDRASVVAVPTMLTRHDVRRISEHLSDLAGVLAFAVDVEARTVTVQGEVTIAQLVAAVTAAGHETGPTPTTSA